MPRVILPRTQNTAKETSARPVPVPEVPPAPRPVAPEHSERILLLEDEEQTNLVLKEYLQSFGYRVVAVANGVDGLKEVMKSDFELIICDMNMPKLPGDMFYLAVQRTRPHLCNRFVFITGHQGTPQVEAFIARTKAAVLVKPFRLQQLEITLESVLSRFEKKEEVAPALRVLPAAPLPVEPIPESKTEPTPPPPVVSLQVEKIPEVPLATVKYSAPEPKPAAPSMVQKALKMVGFLRKAAPVPINPPQPAPKESAPRSTRRISQESGQITRRISHLASTPIQPPTPPPAAPVLAPVVPASPVAEPEAPPKRVSRRIPISLAMTEDLRAKTSEESPVAPKVTRTLKKEESTILRVKDQKSVPAGNTLPRVTRRVPMEQRNLPQTPVAPPKVTRSIPKVTESIPKVTRSVPKVTQSIPKVTQSIPKVTRNVPQVTIRVPKRAKTPEDTAPPRVAAPLSHKVTRTISAPDGNTRASTAKK